MPAKPFRYENQNLLQISLPLGGLGAGCIHLNGWGGFQNFSIRNRPFLSSARPDDWHVADSKRFYESAFGVLHLPDSGETRLVEGPIPAELVYNQGLQAQGYRRGNYEGLPRFDRAVFEGEFPFGHVRLSDSRIPLDVRLTAFNPFVPLDERASGMPGAILEYSFRNRSRKPIRYEFSFHLSHLAVGAAEGERGTRNQALPGRGIFFSNIEPSESETFGTACLMALRGKPAVKGMWFRGPAWRYESVSALWKEVSTGKFTANAGSNGIDVDGRNGGSILFRGVLQPGEEVVHPLAITWHFPNSNEIRGVSDETRKALPLPAWRPWYAGIWKDARAVAEEIRTNYTSLRKRTLAFQDALFSSTVPREVIDAVSANLAILKSPTVMRQENGNLWGWEGCFPDEGCCDGSCTHVWNYAQSLCHLFPALERTLREQEWRRSMDERGHVTFRSALPDGTPKSGFHAAADGQLGGPLKLHRDWRISGDTEWMSSLYPLARRSLEYAIETWDPDRRGALFEPHHNTYDIEFWGPDGMCATIYVGALSAMSSMAASLGKKDDEKTYAALAAKGAAFLDAELFNGAYYQQKVEYAGLRDQSFVRKIADVNAKSSEVLRLLAREGPGCQYGSGCLSDGVIGAWMSSLYGVETPLNRKNVRSTLREIFRHNFKRDLSRHACAQRPGYAMGREPGLLLCSWPRGRKPTIPFIYSDEVWTGIEYQVASHLILEGFVREGLAIVKAVRSRYDGRARNPWDEYECGSYYARAMASYSLLPSLSGFRYDAVEKTLRFGPKTKTLTFSAFFAAANAYGTITLETRTLTVSVLEGKLEIGKVLLDVGGKTIELTAKKTAKPGRPARFSIPR